MTEDVLEIYLGLIPVGFVGIFTGVVNGLNHFTSDYNSSWLDILCVVITSALLCLICFAILAATDLPYLARLGFSAAIGFFGVERGIATIKRIVFGAHMGGDDKKYDDKKPPFKKL